MLHFLYSWQCYRGLKSGLLLDFYFKRVVFFTMYSFFYCFSLFFSDKYLIEYLSFNFFKVYNFIWLYIVSYFSLTYLNLLNLFLFNFIITLLFYFVIIF